MTARRLILALALLPVSSTLAAQTGEEWMHSRTGMACERSSGKPLYRELHEVRREGDRLVEERVTYRRPDGEVFAAKRVDYRGGDLVAPEFELSNSATGHEEALDRRADGLVVRFRASAAERERSATIPPPAGLIADAGFDWFIAENWNRLVSGEALVRPFLVPSRLDSVDMRIRRLPRRGDDSAIGGTTGGTIGFELAIDSALLRLVVPAIRVWYDAATRTMLRYEGISNLRGADGRNLDVTIVFPSTPSADWGCGEPADDDARG